MGGANSGAFFRRVSRRIVLFDEVDAYPASAGDDGDPIELGIKRTEYYSNRKIVAVSTPLIENASRITELFLDGDQRRYHVPCTQCGHMDFLAFSQRKDNGGHKMTWPTGKPEEAYFVCSQNGCVMEHHDKFAMLERGEWIAEQPFEGHASFHIWAAYSMSPNATWGKIAKAFVKAKDAGAEKLRTFINTVLGETFAETGEAPDWERLYSRRENYAPGIIPDDSEVVAITCGIDVQKGYWVYEVVGWGMNKESWSLDFGMIYGETHNIDAWGPIEDLIETKYGGRPINLTAIDSGNWTQVVYSFCARYSIHQVVAVKGQQKQHRLVAPPSNVQIKPNGKQAKRGYKLWNVGVSIAKTELYGFLRLKLEEGQPPPSGYCHFPEYGKEFFLQLTAEHLVRVVKKGGYKVFEWAVIPGRENHGLDCRVYARAAASILGLDRVNGRPKKRKPNPSAKRERERPEVPAPGPRPARPKKRKRVGGWMAKRR
jgi:phage terminase large subunit GpA-like protein